MSEPFRVTVVTIFPEIVRGYFTEGVLGRAVRRGLLNLETVDIRDFTRDPHRTVDDVPFGGGAGMVLKPEPLAQAIESVGPVDRRVLLAANGRRFEERDALAWSKLRHIMLVCGRYEGVDARVESSLMDDVVSIGDYVLSGGELAALVVLDATLRLVPEVLGNPESIEHESFTSGLLEHPQYTRPAEWRGMAVPEVLLTGDHARVEGWRRHKSLQRTAQWRPDLLQSAHLTPTERAFVLDIESGRPVEETIE